MRSVGFFAASAVFPANRGNKRHCSVFFLQLSNFWFCCCYDFCADFLEVVLFVIYLFFFVFVILVFCRFCGTLFGWVFNLALQVQFFRSHYLSTLSHYLYMWKWKSVCVCVWCWFFVFVVGFFFFLAFVNVDWNHLHFHAAVLKVYLHFIHYTLHIYIHTHIHTYILMRSLLAAYTLQVRPISKLNKNFPPVICSQNKF